MTQAPQQEFLTSEECAELANVMNRKHESLRDDRKFSIEAKYEGGEVYVTAVLQNDNETFYYPVEARLDWAEEEMLHRDAALFLIDFMDLYFEDYLENGEDLYLPIDWAPYEYDAVKFQIRGQVLNRLVDRMADELLAQAPS